MDHANTNHPLTGGTQADHSQAQTLPSEAVGQRRAFTKAVGRKFHEDGSVRYFPGNTIICPIGPDNEVYAKLVKAAERFGQLSCAPCFTMLPSSSYHMTVIQGVCEEDRKPQLWSSFLPLDVPLEAADRFFREKWQAVRVPDGFAMTFDYLHTDGVALTVNLQPNTAADAQSLRRFRDEVSEQFGLRFPDHDVYRFHISLGYRIAELTGREEEELLRFKQHMEAEWSEQFGVYRSAPPQLVFFKDMFKFAETR
ncbi:DUF1868 domain-containing protein [Paenibacillus thalictri]|uniref:DUF1868 domain-containing protein n=1 Tax=Paenibacillus thalictri TaxID=2527873 RepID=A0A4Q9DX87_9BACL|nr:DUF1868 domain-containing protein [Paenibacillus thalictri]TBL80660.1 DUF1868 domain-containing protein [Paenibacillus thalictri]